MGLPSVNISFKEKAATAIKRGNRGIVVLILKQAAGDGTAVVTLDPNNTSVINQGNVTVTDVLTFKGMVTNAGAYKFTYSATDTSWQLGGANVVLADYAITCNDTPTDGDKFTVELITKKEQALYELTTTADIEPSMGLSDKQKEYVTMAFTGYINPPKRVYLAMMDSEATDYVEVEEMLESFRWDYLAIPELEDSEATNIATWLKSTGKKSKVVLPNCQFDSERVINFTSTGVIDNYGKTYTTAEYCARLAGIFAGTPLNIACTYATLPEIADFNRIKKSAMDAAINNGELILYHDGAKVKVARGVNSLTTTTQDKGDSFKKIKIIDAIDMIYDDIKSTCEDSYLGKYANSYDNKCLLLSAINGYFDKLVLDGVLDNSFTNVAEIDVEAQRAYLKGIGVDVKDMTDAEVKKYNTKDQVFLKANIKVLDAIEDITLNITI